MDKAERRVVVTGLGMVTPVGIDVESTWESLKSGRGGVGPISLFDAGTFPTRIAAELKEFRLARYLGDGAVRWENHGRNTQIAWRRPRRRSRNRACWSTRKETRPDSEFTWGRARASKIFRASST